MHPENFASPMSAQSDIPASAFAPAPSSAQGPRPNDDTGGGIGRWANHEFSPPASSEALGLLHQEQHAFASVLHTLHSQQQEAMQEQQTLHALVAATTNNPDAMSRLEAAQHQHDATVLQADLRIREVEAQNQYLESQLQAQSEFHSMNHEQVKQHYQQLVTQYKAAESEARALERDQIEAKAAASAARKIASASDAVKRQAKQEAVDMKSKLKQELSAQSRQRDMRTTQLEAELAAARDKAMQSEQAVSSIQQSTQAYAEQLRTVAEQRLHDKDDEILALRIKNLDEPTPTISHAIVPSQPPSEEVDNLRSTVSITQAKVEETHALVRALAQDQEGMHGRRAAEDQSRMRRLEKDKEAQTQRIIALEQENALLKTQSSSAQHFELTPGASGFTTPRSTSPNLCQPCADPTTGSGDESDPYDSNDYDYDEWGEEGYEEEAQSQPDACTTDGSASETEGTTKPTKSASTKPKETHPSGSSEVDAPAPTELPTSSLQSSNPVFPLGPTATELPESPLDSILGLKKQKVPAAPTSGLFAVPGLQSTEYYRNQELDALEEERKIKFTKRREQVKKAFSMMTIKDMKDPHKQCVKSNPTHWNFGTMPTSTTRQAWLDKATEVFAKGVRNFEWGTALVRFAEVHKHWTGASPTPQKWLKIVTKSLTFKAKRFWKDLEA